jgi:hypothetical protein
MADPLDDADIEALKTCQAIVASHRNAARWPEVRALVAAHAALVERLNRADEERAWLRTHGRAVAMRHPDLLGHVACPPNVRRLVEQALPHVLRRAC